MMRTAEAPVTVRRPRVLSGFRPTGPMHIGHLVGALDNWIKMQDTHECFFAICDWHALTSEYADTSRLKEYVEDMALDWLAAGLDPDKCTIFVQSHRGPSRWSRARGSSTSSSPTTRQRAPSLGARRRRSGGAAVLPGLVVPEGAGLLSQPRDGGRSVSHRPRDRALDGQRDVRRAGPAHGLHRIAEGQANSVFPVAHCRASDGALE